MITKTFPLCISMALFAAVLFDIQTAVAGTIRTMVLGCENCTGEIVVTVDVTVTANPDSQTVGIRSAGTAESIGKNTAQYDISGSCKTRVVGCLCTNVSLQDPTWSFACPVRIPTVSLSGSGSSRTLKVYASTAGSATITVTAGVTYRLKNINTGSYLLDENGGYLTLTFPGSGTCRFRATISDFRIVLVPEDNFAGRSLSSLGVGETGTIKVEPIGTAPPSGIFPLRSFSSSNNASLAAVLNLNAGTATFRAGNLAGSAVVTAVDKNGHAETYSITVVEPSGVRQEKIMPTVMSGWKAPNPNDDMKLYKDNACAVAMNAASYLEPRNVSFNKIKVGEGECRSVGTGSQYPSRHGIVHPASKVGVSKGNIITGCKVGGYDFISETRLRNVGAGTFTWNIPWEYHSIPAPGSSAAFSKKFATLTHRAVFDGNRGVTLSKAGNSVQHTTP